VSLHVLGLGLPDQGGDVVVIGVVFMGPLQVGVFLAITDGAPQERTDRLLDLLTDALSREPKRARVRAREQRGAPRRQPTSGRRARNGRNAFLLNNLFYLERFAPVLRPGIGAFFTAQTGCLDSGASCRHLHERSSSKSFGAYFPY
jgi:hypothetical protein